ncbi:MAG: hypothetical protein HYS70_06480 [Nitrospinae bacterium]|nr:hypothetical protein [Nitrospinota bacterium]
MSARLKAALRCASPRQINPKKEELTMLKKLKWKWIFLAFLLLFSFRQTAHAGLAAVGPNSPQNGFLPNSIQGEEI